MKKKRNTNTKQTKQLHPRNSHQGKYDFEQLITTCPALKNFVFTNEYGNQTIDFSDNEAVKTLNKGLLMHFYDLSFWDIPKGYLCPPIPGRADYMHYLADLLASNFDDKIPMGRQVRGLDIGVGANCIYPIIGQRVYRWDFVGSDINEKAIANAQNIITQNNGLKNAISLRKQNQHERILEGIIQANEFFDFTMCNPPFHRSAKEALEGTNRKWSNLKKEESDALNFGGQTQELWCEGGELQFISQMIEESIQFKTNCLWFTSLVSKKENLLPLKEKLKAIGAVQIQIKEMAQGQKISRFIAWSFLDKTQAQKWGQLRWKRK